MVKLEGVKTLDMVNGEITKVAYGGAEYERVGNVGEHGDIALRIAKPASFAEVGQFYPVVKEFEILRFIDDEGEKPSIHADRFVFFRKVSAGNNPSVEDRVTKAEGEIESLKSDVAALKGEAEYKRISVDEAQPGDYVKFDEAPRGYLTAGKYYEIDYVDSNGDPYITDDAGDVFDTYCLDDDEFEVYRKVSAASVEAEPKPERLKVGDYAKIVAATDYHSFRDGDIVEIVEDPFTGPINECARKITGGVTQYVPKRQLVRATDEEVAEAKRAAAERKKWAEFGRKVGEYKVGDIFRDHLGSFYEITRIDDRLRHPIRFTNVFGRDDGYTHESKLTLVTPVEARFDR